MSDAFPRTLVRGLVQIFYPNLCWVCRQAITPEQGAFCPACHAAAFTDPASSCPRCAATVGPFTAVEKGCPHCRDQRFTFDAAIRLGPYEGPLRQLILLLKEAHHEGVAELVAGEWVNGILENLDQFRIACVVPVPLHWWRRWQRGYNQSEALARVLAGTLGIPCRPEGLRRVRATARQADLSPTARRENMRGAFQARAGVPLQGQTVLLVDDVMTTGATANEAARALKQSGAARVVVAVLARAEL